MSMNFGYNFGVPQEENDKNKEAEGSSPPTTEDFNGNISFGNQNGVGQSQTSDFSIDFNQITPPTFRFGQFGQAPLPSDSNADQFNVADDDDSFLAEPSMSAGQFDSTFNFQNEFASSNSADSLENAQAPSPSISSKSSHSSVPALVEEPAEQPVYLEEPAPHSVEELLKATIDGDTTAVMAESWENVGIEEIEAAEAEFSKISQELEVESSAEQAEAAIKNQVEEPEAEPSESVEPETEIEEQIVEDVKPAKSKAVKSEAAKSSEPAKKPRAKKVVDKVKSEAAKIVVDTSAGRSKRERKAVERLAESEIQPKKSATEKAPLIPEGKGLKLGDIEVISQNLNKKLASDKNVVLLHRIIFDRMGEARHRKASLRAYCGREGASFEAKLQKHTKVELTDLATFLGLTGANEKAVLANKISDFLVKPNKETVKLLTKAEKAAKKAPAKKAKKSAVPVRTSKRRNPEPEASEPKKATKSSKKSSAKPSAKTTYLTPEIIDSDVESEVEREVLKELNQGL